MCLLQSAQTFFGLGLAYWLKLSFQETDNKRKVTVSTEMKRHMLMLLNVCSVTVKMNSIITTTTIY